MSAVVDQALLAVIEAGLRALALDIIRQNRAAALAEASARHGHARRNKAKLATDHVSVHKIPVIVTDRPPNALYVPLHATLVRVLTPDQPDLAMERRVVGDTSGRDGRQGGGRGGSIGGAGGLRGIDCGWSNEIER